MVAEFDAESGKNYVLDCDEKNTVLAGNTATTGSDCGGLNGGAVISLGYNLFSSLAGCTVNGDTTGNSTTDPMLGPLADNGGPTRTHLRLAESPAIDTGNPAAPGSGGSACDAKDQRGVGRPVGAVCDRGATEE